MTELPKKLQERIDKEVSKRGYDRFNYAKRCAEVIAQELYADLAMAMEALERWDKHWCDDYLEMIHGDLTALLCELRAKYNDQETEGGE